MYDNITSCVYLNVGVFFFYIFSCKDIVRSKPMIRHVWHWEISSVIQSDHKLS